MRGEQSIKFIRKEILDGDIWIIKWKHWKIWEFCNNFFSKLWDNKNEQEADFSNLSSQFES